jgi:molecular chaperone GrpE
MADKPLAEPADDSAVETSQGQSASDEALFELQRERDDLHDRLLRKTAEFDNYRKRVERERREQADQAVTDLLEELLLVVDDFDRALLVGAAPAGPGGKVVSDASAVNADDVAAAAAYRKGVELIHAKLHDLLRKRGVRPIESLGSDFDPTLHQAVIHESSPDHREGEVIGELRRGYLIGDRLLRAAMVKVAKA